MSDGSREPPPPFRRSDDSPDRFSSAQPWVPKAGVHTGPTAEEIEAMKAERLAEGHRLQRRWETWQSIRRYLLVILLATLGGMISSAITIYVFTHL